VVNAAVASVATWSVGGVVTVDFWAWQRLVKARENIAAQNAKADGAGWEVVDKFGS
jgi:hypothetical protein